MAAAESCNLNNQPTWRIAALSSKPGASRAIASLHVAPLKKPSLAAGQEIFCCFDPLSASTVTWVYFPGLVQRPALARPPPGTTRLSSWAQQGSQGSGYQLIAASTSCKAFRAQGWPWEGTLWVQDHSAKLCFPGRRTFERVYQNI